MWRHWSSKYACLHCVQFFRVICILVRFDFCVKLYSSILRPDVTVKVYWPVKADYLSPYFIHIFKSVVIFVELSKCIFSIYF